MYVTGCWGSPAIFGSVFPSKRRVLGLDLTFPSDWKKWVWVSEFSAGGGEGGGGRRWCWCQEKVLFSVRQWPIVVVAPRWSPWDGRSAEGIHRFGEFLSLETMHFWCSPKWKHTWQLTATFILLWRTSLIVWLPQDETESAVALLTWRVPLQKNKNKIK